VPKHENFDHSFLPLFYAIWVDYSVCKTILSAHLYLLRIVFSFFENTRRLRIHIQFTHIHRAYAYELYEYAQHTLTNCMHMLSMRVRKNASKSYGSNAYAEDTLTNCMHMLCIRIQNVCLRSVYVYNLYSYAQHMHMTPKTHRAYK